MSLLKFITVGGVLNSLVTSN